MSFFDNVLMHTGIEGASKMRMFHSDSVEAKDVHFGSSKVRVRLLIIGNSLVRILCLKSNRKDSRIESSWRFG